jgi:uncharacterized protein YbjT (DUF2867 family)
MAGRAAKVIVVTGATGNQGGAAAARLLADGWRVRALTRNQASPAARRLVAAGAQVVTADLDERDSLNAAAHARAAHLVYMSVAGAERSAGVRAFASKREIEEHIRGLGVPATILRPASFMDNYADPAFGMQTGSLASPFAPDVPEQLIALDDIGAFVALAFSDPARYLGNAIAIAGDELRPPQTAEALSRATGRHIPYVQIPVEAVREQSHDAADAVSFLNDNGGYGADIRAARALHPGLMTFSTWLDSHGKAKLAELLGTPSAGTPASETEA